MKTNMHYGATPAIFRITKELRMNPTRAEELLWEEIRNKKLGYRFRRQHPIGVYIVDFYCHKAALVVEVDGDIHDLQQDEDDRRAKALSELGLRVVRFGNDEVLRDTSRSTVVRRIKGLVLE